MNPYKCRGLFIYIVEGAMSKVFLVFVCLCFTLSAMDFCGNSSCSLLEESEIEVIDPEGGFARALVCPILVVFVYFFLTFLSGL